MMTKNTKMLNYRKTGPKKHKLKSLLKKSSILIFTLSSLTSCVNMEKATYFHNSSNSVFGSSELDNLEPILRSSDLLSISVSSINPEAAEVFNKSNNVATQTSTVSGKTAQVSGYLIDEDGLIHFPILGNIKAAGLTKKELREEIENQLNVQKLLIDPLVDIRYLNFKVSVLGEVNSPSVLTIPNEKVSLLEALGLAGDITIYGNKENVSIIREENGLKKITTIDLTTTNIFRSPFYYLKSNDIVYVAPTKAKVSSASQSRQWIPVILSAISLAIVAVVTLNSN